VVFHCLSAVFQVKSGSLTPVGRENIRVATNALPALLARQQSVSLLLSSLGIMRSCDAAPMFKGPLSTRRARLTRT
jgi:hypothetical protein